MGRRSAEAWRELFEAQARSGMSVWQFCAKRGLCARSFLRRRKEQGQEAVNVPASPFVRIEAAERSSREISVPRARLRVGRCEWELSGLGVDELIHVIAALA
jgi:hypothetical protein